jgi:exoribonuclease R
LSKRRGRMQEARENDEVCVACLPDDEQNAVAARAVKIWHRIFPKLRTTTKTRISFKRKMQKKAFHIQQVTASPRSCNKPGTSISTQSHPNN